MRKPNEIPSVTELTWRIKDLLEGNFSGIAVAGEVSQPTLSRNGHLYFTLKDDGAQIACVIWKSTVQRMRGELQHGQQIHVRGDVAVYAPSGRYQIIVKGIEQAGEGALQAAFERLKAKLEAEGLFSAERKRPLPAFPKVIGVVTSQTGAAFQDIRSTLERRYPLARVLLYHAAVQGVGAAGEISKGIAWFSQDPPPADVLIVGRGGGSLEDLWPFNEEVVARALAACPVPVVSAVGHETDFSISDFVADVRAATPTQAAVLVSPDVQDLQFQLDGMSTAAERAVRRRIDSGNDTIRKMVKTHALLAIRDQMQLSHERIQRFQERLRSALRQQTTSSREIIDRGKRTLLPGLRLRLMQHREERNKLQRSLLPAQRLLLNTEKERLSLVSRSAEPLVRSRFQRDYNRWQQLHYRLGAVNPTEPLERGFTRILQQEKWIRSRKDLDVSQPVTIEWKDGNSTR
ncbi:MAG: exodeoxyribonuclease VII large subunit [Bacteroidetes bacterium]|nr:exodeoxyribonuclease VII large subunit [Bacteroidota bacterium]